MAKGPAKASCSVWSRRVLKHPLALLLLVACILLVLVGVSVALYKNFAVEQYTSVASYYPPGDSPDRIRLAVRLLAIDMLNHRISLSIRTFPEGRYRYEQNTPSQNISVQIDSTLRKFWFLTGMPIPILPYDIGVNTVGDPNLFPFDVETATFNFRAYGFNDPALVIPVAVEFVNNVATFSVTTSLTASTDSPAEQAAQAVKINITIERLTTVKVYATFCAILCWVLAIVVLMLSLDSFFEQRRVELPILALCTGMMFALPAIRNTNPGIPPIGTLFDVYSFMFAQFMISFIAAALIVFYLVKVSNISLIPKAEKKADSRAPVAAAAGAGAGAGAMAGVGTAVVAADDASYIEKTNAQAAGVSNTMNVYSSSAAADMTGSTGVDGGAPTTMTTVDFGGMDSSGMMFAS